MKIVDRLTIMTSSVTKMECPNLEHLEGKYGQQTVRITRLHRDAAREDIQPLLKQGFILSNLQHPNIISFIFVGRIDDRMHLITESSDYGSLSECLRCNLLSSSCQLVDTSLQICAGMTYLHDRSIIHGNLTAENCVVTALFPRTEVKIAGFHSSRFTDEITEYPPPKPLTKQKHRKCVVFQLGQCEDTSCCPPSADLTEPTARASHAQDVADFGRLLWTIFDSGQNTEGQHFTTEQLKDWSAIPEALASSVKQVIQACCCQETQLRPTFPAILSSIQELPSTLRNNLDIGDAPSMCSSPTSVQTECKLQIAKTVPIALDNSEEPTENFSFAEDFREITEIKERIGSFFKVAKRRKSQDLNSSTDSFASEHSPQNRGRKYSYSMTLWPTDAPNTHAHREEFLEEEQQSKIYKLANTVKMLHEKLLREKQRKEELLNYCAKCEEGCLLQVDRMVDLFKRRVHTLERKASHFETMAKRARREKELVQKSHLQTTKMLQDSLETIKTELDNVRANNVELAKRTNKLNDEKNSLKRRIHDMDVATYAKADLKELELEVSNVRVLYELALDRLKLYEGGLTKRYRQEKLRLHESLPVVNLIPCSGLSVKDDDITVSDDVQNEDDVRNAYSALSTPGSNRNMSPSCEADVSESDQEDDEGTTDIDKIGNSFLETTKISPTLVANGAVKQMSVKEILTSQTDKPPTVQKSTSLPNESMLAVLARLERLHRTNKQTPSPELEASAESLPTNINLNTKNQELLAEESEFIDENVSMCEENYFRNISSDPDLSDAERRSSANSNDCDLNSSSSSVLRRSSSGSTFSRIRNRRNGVVAGTIGPLPLLMGGKQSRKSKDFTNVLKHFNINRGSVMTPQRRRKSSKIASMMSISQACEEGGEG